MTKIPTQQQKLWNGIPGKQTPFTFFMQILAVGRMYVFMGS